MFRKETQDDDAARTSRLRDAHDASMATATEWTQFDQVLAAGLDPVAPPTGHDYPTSGAGH
jgi:hypothetical protein